MFQIDSRSPQSAPATEWTPVTADSQPYSVRRDGSDTVRPSVSLEHFAIIYFGNDWFAENRTSSHHVAERLAERTRVLYVDVPGLRAPKATGRDLKKLCRKLLSARGGRNASAIACGR